MTRNRRSPSAAGTKTPKPDYDSPWKEILTSYFPDFMAFFFPDAYADINWERGYVFLDKELRQVTRDAELGRRLADKLVKVWRKDGEEIWVLVHVEIQGSEEGKFAKRMFVYNYRIFDRYDHPVASLAILTDDRPSWRPDRYGYTLWGCEMGIRFPVVKVLDHATRWEDLDASANPFAAAVMAHIKARETTKDSTERQRWKFALVRRLYEKGYDRQKITDLFRFIDWLMSLPEELEHLFWQELEQYEEKKAMPYVTSVERIGIKKGRQQGLEEGLQKGLQKGQTTLLLKQLALKFGSAVDDTVRERIAAANTTELEHWGERILSANSLAEVFEEQ